MSLRSGYGAVNSGPSGIPGGYSTPSSFQFDQPKITQPADTTRPGSLSFNFTDPGGSISKSMESGGRLIGSAPGGDLVGDALGFIGGSLGKVADFIIPGDLGLGDVANAAGGAISFLSTEEQKAAARDRLNQSLGRPSGLTSTITDVLGGIGSFFTPNTNEFIVAQQAHDAGQDPAAAVAEYRKSIEGVPQDYVSRARAGEDIDALAQEMTDNNIGFSSDPTKQMGALILADPLNLVSFGLGKIGSAGKIVKYADESKVATLNPVMRASGQVYNALTAGATAPVRLMVRATIGPATSGIVRAYNAGRYADTLKVIGNISKPLQAEFKKYLDTNTMQMIRAVQGRLIGRRWDPVMRESVADGVAVENVLQRTLRNAEKAPESAKLLDESVEITARRVIPKYEGMADDAVRAEGKAILAQTLPDAPEMLGAKLLDGLAGKALKQTVGILHGARYGRAVDEFAPLREALIARNAPNAARYTPLAEGTLSKEGAEEALAAIGHDVPVEVGAAGLTAAGKGAKAAATTAKTFDMAAAHAAVEKYEVLAQHFIGRQYTAEQVYNAIKALRDSDGLVEVVTKGLPKELKAWSEKFGYGIARAPRSGWKATILDDGSVVVGDAFIHVQALQAATNVRNPLGRLGDNLFASIHQRQLVLSSEFRLADFMVSKGFGSKAQAIGIHRAALRAAADEGVAPRVLGTLKAKAPKRYSNRLDEIFAEGLGDNRVIVDGVETSPYLEFLKKSSPRFAFNRALKGYFSEVGYSQWLTGKLKEAEAGGTRTAFLVKVSEDLYSKARFTFNPFFQLQERIETVFWMATRGIVHRDLDPEVRKAIVEAVEGTAEGGKLFEEFGPIFLAGGDNAARAVIEGSGVGARLRRVLQNVTDVAGTKREATIQQVFNEYAPQVEKILVAQEPKLWAAMVDAAGSTDARTVVEHWVKGQQELMDAAKVEAALAKAKAKAQAAPGGTDAELFGNADEVAHQARLAYDAGNHAEGVRLDAIAKELRGGTAGSGGASSLAGTGQAPTGIEAKLAAAEAKAKAAPLWNPDTETIWNAYDYALRRTAQVAKQTQYFREGRGWLERGLNHPFLGLYPLSYATKVMMEFGRFLLVKPFGLNAPLAGAAAMNKFQQAVLNEMSDPDSGLKDFVDKNPIMVNFINQMLPYWPTNIAVNAPLWVKDIAAQAERGKGVPENMRTKKNQNVTIGDVGTAVARQSSLYLSGPTRLFTDLLGATDDYMEMVFPGSSVPGDFGGAR